MNLKMQTVKQFVWAPCDLGNLWDTELLYKVPSKKDSKFQYLIRKPKVRKLLLINLILIKYNNDEMLKNYTKDMQTNKAI